MRPGGRVDVRQLQTNPVDYPVELRVTGLADINALDEEKNIRTLRWIASQVAGILHSAPVSALIRDDWGQDGFEVILKVRSDRANLAGISNMDVANSATSAMSGTTVTSLQDGDKNIPVVARLQWTSARASPTFRISTSTPIRAPKFPWYGSHH